MRSIGLTQGQTALVDDADYESLALYKWCALRRRRGGFYAVRMSPRSPGPRKMIFMHRVIVGAPETQLVDHENGNGLDNQRANLRCATPFQNQQNRTRQSNNRSGYKGVSFDKSSRRWVANISAGRRRYRQHGFTSPAEAAAAYNSMAIELHGEFAVLNHLVAEVVK